VRGQKVKFENTHGPEDQKSHAEADQHGTHATKGSKEEKTATSQRIHIPFKIAGIKNGCQNGKRFVAEETGESRTGAEEKDPDGKNIGKILGRKQCAPLRREDCRATKRPWARTKQIQKDKATSKRKQNLHHRTRR